MSPTENGEFLKMSTWPDTRLLDLLTDAAAAVTDELAEAPTDMPLCYFRDRLDRVKEYVSVVRSKRIAALDECIPEAFVAPVPPSPDPPPVGTTHQIDFGDGKGSRPVLILRRRPSATA
jgi:hypothetical protein